MLICPIPNWDYSMFFFLQMSVVLLTDLTASVCPWLEDNMSWPLQYVLEVRDEKRKLRSDQKDLDSRLQFPLFGSQAGGTDCPFSGCSLRAFRMAILI